MLKGLDGGVLLQWVMLGIIVGGAVYYGRRGEAKRIAHEVNDGNIALVNSRGKKIDDMQVEITALLQRLLIAEAEIQTLKDERVDRIVEGVIVGLRPFLQPDSAPS